MQCPRCHEEAPADAEFCPECGAQLAGVCAQCGTGNAPRHKFCKKCGQSLGAAADALRVARFASPDTYTPKHLAEKTLTSKSALEGERKQVTVLFADLKGSIKLLARSHRTHRWLGEPRRHVSLRGFLAIRLWEGPFFCAVGREWGRLLGRTGQPLE